MRSASGTPQSRQQQQPEGVRSALIASQPGGSGAGQATATLRGSPLRQRYRLTPDGVAVPLPPRPAQQRKAGGRAAADHSECRLEIARLTQELEAERAAREAALVAGQGAEALRREVSAGVREIAAARDKERAATAAALQAKQELMQVRAAADAKCSENQKWVQQFLSQREELDDQIAAAVAWFARIQRRAEAVLLRTSSPGEDPAGNAPVSPTFAAQSALNDFAAACREGTGSASGERSPTATGTPGAPASAVAGAGESAMNAVQRAFAELGRLCEEQASRQEIATRGRMSHSELETQSLRAAAELQQTRRRHAALERELKDARVQADARQKELTALREDLIRCETARRDGMSDLERMNGELRPLREALAQMEKALEQERAQHRRAKERLAQLDATGELRRRLAASRAARRGAGPFAHSRPWCPTGGGFAHPLCEDVLRDAVPQAPAAARPRETPAGGAPEAGPAEAAADAAPDPVTPPPPAEPAPRPSGVLRPRSVTPPALCRVPSSSIRLPGGYTR
eukprot:TRINITY_DN26476_c0_g1_i1.p1 TRINITY_DN26476_c0_g1~~TRINITY_DN26476_c0_g1_i1.p1  ORF type:complete len:547 (+),score=145.98 TRINITY_DN26476_c0_g1_i1:85-1641(+)